MPFFPRQDSAMAPRSEIAATKLRLALLKSLCNPGAQPSWLWGRRASCPPTKEQSNRQDACLPHRLEAYAPPAPKLFQQGQAASTALLETTRLEAASTYRCPHPNPTISISVHLELPES